MSGENLIRIKMSGKNKVLGKRKKNQKNIPLAFLTLQAAIVDQLKMSGKLQKKKKKKKKKNKKKKKKRKKKKKKKKKMKKFQQNQETVRDF